MSRFVCTTCETDGCDWPIKPGAAVPVAIVCGGSEGGGGGSTVASLLACYENNQIEVRHTFGSDGTLTSTAYFDHEGNDITGTVATEDLYLGNCGNNSAQVVKFYDNNGVFLRVFDPDSMGGYSDYQVDGNVYTPVGTIYGEPPASPAKTLSDDGTPTLITGAFSIPTNLRAFTIAVVTGPVLINGITVQTGFVMSREANTGEVLPSFDIDGTGGQIIFDSIREV